MSLNDPIGHKIAHKIFGPNDSTQRKPTVVFFGDSHAQSALYEQSYANLTTVSSTAAIALTADSHWLRLRLTATAPTTNISATVLFQDTPDATGGSPTWTTRYTQNLSVANWASASDDQVIDLDITPVSVNTRITVSIADGSNWQVQSTVYRIRHATTTNPWNWANAMLGAPFIPISNAGIGGQTTTQMVARFGTDVVALKPGWVVIWGGENDGDNATTTIANLRTMYEMAKKNDINVLAMEMYPVAGASGGAADTLARRKVNRWIQQYCDAHAHCFFVPTTEPLVDRASLSTFCTGNANTSLIAAIHLNTEAAYKVGKYIYNYFNGKGVLPQARKRAFVLWDGVSFTGSTGDPYALMANSEMYGTGGSVAGTNPVPSGDVAAGWSLISSNSGTTTSVVGSKVARTDGFSEGEAQRITVTGQNNPAGGSYNTYRNRLDRYMTLTSGGVHYMETGGQYYLEADISIEATTGHITAMYLEAEISMDWGVPFVIYAHRLSATPVGGTAFTVFNGVLQTPIFTVPAQTGTTRRMYTRQSVIFSDGGAGTLTVNSIRCYKYDPAA